MKLMMWMALAKRLFTAINRTVSVIFMAVNPERCVRPSCYLSSGSPGAAQTSLASNTLGWKEDTADGRTQCPIGNVRWAVTSLEVLHPSRGSACHGELVLG